MSSKMACCASTFVITIVALGSNYVSPASETFGEHNPYFHQQHQARQQSRG